MADPNDDLNARSLALADECAAEAAKHEKRAAELRALERSIREGLRAKGLTSVNKAGTLTTVTPAQRMAVSRAFVGDDQDDFLKAIRAAGFTLRSLAEHKSVDVSAAYLSQCRAVDGRKRASDELKATIERLTGWPKDQWPR